MPAEPGRRSHAATTPDPCGASGTTRLLFVLSSSVGVTGQPPAVRIDANSLPCAEITATGRPSPVNATSEPSGAPGRSSTFSAPDHVPVPAGRK